jgi:hypothetical protein
MNISFGSGSAFGGFPGFKARRQRFGIGSLLFLMLFGAIFTGLGWLGVSGTRVDPSWTRVQGKVVSSSSHTSDGSTTYAPVVEYIVGGQTYNIAGSVSTSSAPQIGSLRTVAYNPGEPNVGKVVESGTTLWFVYLFPAVGVLLFLLGPVLFMLSVRRSALITKLKMTGQKLQGVIVDIQGGGIRQAGSSSSRGYRILVSATDNAGVVQNYTSDTLGGLGGLAMMNWQTSPIPIDVYVDQSNPKNYYVDVSEIPNLTPERITELIKSATTMHSLSQDQQSAPNPLVGAGQADAAPSAGPDSSTAQAADSINHV